MYNAWRILNVRRLNMGSTTVSAQLTPSTFVAGITQGAVLSMTAVTSSGVYVNVGDASRIMFFIANWSTGVAAVYFDPGARWAGSLQMPVSTAPGIYSTATAPIAVSLAACPSSISTTAGLSTVGNMAMVGPFEAVNVKSSDVHIFMYASTAAATQVTAAVYALTGGSTN